MSNFLLAGGARWGSLCLILGCVVGAQAGETPSTDFGEATPLFDAIKADQIEARVIPSDSKRLTLIVENKTDRPVHLVMPTALAATPVLAQQGNQFGFPGLNQANGANANAPQALGFPGGQNGGNFGNGQNGNNFNGFFNIPPGKTIKRRLPCVCLEHGRPDPQPRIDYELRPIDDVTDDARLVAVVGSLADEQIHQSVVQLAAWHYANGMSWDELAKLRRRHINGITEPWFSLAEVAAARKLADRIGEQRDVRSGGPDESSSLARPTQTRLERANAPQNRS